MGGMTQRPWTPTKRRGPIAAEFKGPGPACVSLQSYIGRRTLESKTERAPAFSFGSRQNGKFESIGPGPGQYNVTGMSAKGKDTPPALSLHSRPKEHKPENFPAPGDYNPDKAEKVIHDSAPKFTFGLKTNSEKRLDTPAPNVYKIPETISLESPKYTFGTKVNLEKTQKIPAPNSYDVPRADNVIRRSLRYSFGRKTNSNNISKNPAPNVYNIPSGVGDGKSPAYTISGRTKEPVDERVKNPAPGQYNNVDPEFYKSHSPAYTMSARVNIPKDDKIPGPGVYSPEKVVSHLHHAPSHSFGIRHSPYLGTQHGCLRRESTSLLF